MPSGAWTWPSNCFWRREGRAGASQRIRPRPSLHARLCIAGHGGSSGGEGAGSQLAACTAQCAILRGLQDTSCAPAWIGTERWTSSIRRWPTPTMERRYFAKGPSCILRRSGGWTQPHARRLLPNRPITCRRLSITPSRACELRLEGGPSRLCPTLALSNRRPIYVLESCRAAHEMGLDEDVELGQRLWDCWARCSAGARDGLADAGRRRCNSLARFDAAIGSDGRRTETAGRVSRRSAESMCGSVDIKTPWRPCNPLPRSLRAKWPPRADSGWQLPTAIWASTSRHRPPSRAPGAELERGREHPACKRKLFRSAVERGEITAGRFRSPARQLNGYRLSTRPDRAAAIARRVLLPSNCPLSRGPLLLPRGLRSSFSALCNAGPNRASKLCPDRTQNHRSCGARKENEPCFWNDSKSGACSVPRTAGLSAGSSRPLGPFNCMLATATHERQAPAARTGVSCGRCLYRARPRWTDHSHDVHLDFAAPPQTMKWACLPSMIIRAESASCGRTTRATQPAAVAAPAVWSFSRAVSRRANQDRRSARRFAFRTVPDRRQHDDDFPDSQSKKLALQKAAGLFFVAPSQPR